MKNKSWLLVLLVTLIGIVVFAYSSKYRVLLSNNPAASNESTYKNFGFTFQYPKEWGIPEETLYGNGLGTIFFGTNQTSGQPFSIYIAEDQNPMGSGLMNETFDQMVARFMVNDKDIVPNGDIIVNGVHGKEFLYKSAVTGQLYHVEVFLPLQNHRYISISADYDYVPLQEFNTIVSSIKFEPGVSGIDSATGMQVYSNNGFTFEYPSKFNTKYANLSLNIGVGTIDKSQLDSNGCYPGMNGSGRLSTTSLISINGNQFCYTESGEAGMGQLSERYSYTIFKNGLGYNIDYIVGTSNGCGVYSDELLNECQAFRANYENLILKPIQQSIATFRFTN